MKNPFLIMLIAVALWLARVLRMDNRGLAGRGYIIMLAAILLGTMATGFITPLLGSWGQNEWIFLLVFAGFVYGIFIFVQKRFGNRLGL